MICTLYDGLHYYQNIDSPVNIWQLELKGLEPEKDIISYNDEVWSSLQYLWIGNTLYLCTDGLCHKLEHSPTTPNDNADNGNDEDDDEPNIMLTDAGIILMCIITLVLLFVGGLCCKEHWTQISTCLRRRLRGGGQTLGGQEIEIELSSVPRIPNSVNTPNFHSTPVNQSTRPSLMEEPAPMLEGHTALIPEKL
jgi:hypothetical protein